MIVYDDPEAWARMNVGRGMEYDGEGSLILLTWSVLLPSLLHYPHTYPITAAPYLLVVLVDTKMLKQQQCELSEPANAHVCFLITYPFLPPTRRALLGGRIYTASRFCFDFSGQKDGYSNGCTCTDLLPLSTRTYRRPRLKT